MNTINIEDLITTLAYKNIAKCNNWDKTLIYSFSDQISRGLGFTEKQANLACKILRKHTAVLSAFYRTDITPFLSSPTYRNPIRTVITVKKISIVEDSTYIKLIKAEFPYNDKIVEEIKRCSWSRSQIDNSDSFYAAWNKELKAWTFNLCEQSIKFTSELFKENEFIWDQEFKNYYQQCLEIQSNLEKYVPMLALDQNGLKYLNIDENVPKLESNDPISAIFEARKRGILVWDNNIEQELQNSNLQTVTKEFLKTNPSENFDINSDQMPIECLADFIKYMTPCLIIIPGGFELEKLQESHNLLTHSNIRADEVSVTFRLPSTTGKEFNQYVKDHKFNNPLSDQIKVIFVSSKLTKPLIKSNINFNSVINLGHGNVHYTMRDFVQKHENLIHYSMKSTNQASQLLMQTLSTEF